VKLLAVLLLALQFAAPVKIADGFDAATSGLFAADVDGDGKPEIIAWSANGIRVFSHDTMKSMQVGLGGVRDILSVSRSNFNNGGPEDLAILTKSGAQLWVNRGGRFQLLNIFLPEGAYNKAVWADYDHDGLLDLFLLGDKSVLLRNDGAGFTNMTNNFPFVQGGAWDGRMQDGNLLVFYSDRPGVRYVDKGHGLYVAEEANEIPAGTQSVRTGAALEMDYDGDGRVDRFEIRQDGSLVWVRGSAL
jgi:hypothetical protein